MDILLLILTVFFSLLLGAIIFIRDTKSHASRLFGAMSVLIAIWIAANYITNHSKDFGIDVSGIANHIAYVSAYLIVLAGLSFTYYFPDRRKWRNMEAIGLFLLSAITLGLSLTPLVAGELVQQADGGVDFSVGPLLWFYGCSFVVLLGFIARNLMHIRKNNKTVKGQQAFVILLAFCMTALSGLFLSVILPAIGSNWNTTRLSPVVVVILVGFIAYTIIRHKTFDIKLAAVRTIVYIISLLTLAIVYYFLAYIASAFVLGSSRQMSANINPVDILLALILAFMFQPIRRFFDRVTNNIFYRHQYKSEDFFASFNEVLMSTTDLRSLLEKASQEISQTLKTEYTLLHIRYGDDRHMSAGTKKYPKLPRNDVEKLNEYVAAGADEVIVTSNLEPNSPIYRLLVSHHIALLMPLVRASSILGYVALGEQRSAGYTARDTKILQAISSELMIAVQNALSVQQVKDINAKLEQKIDAATKELRTSNMQLRHLDTTKDEFLSMASHQLRTPLTSVKGYLSMVLEGDAGEVTETQKQLLSEAYTSSERMVHLIHDFLNVSRLQTGKFMLEKHECDFAKLVEEEVQSLQRAAELRNLELHFSNKVGEAMVVVDENKFRQVVMNFIDNALYYSKENSKIIVELDETESHLSLRVKDKGIGVPKHEQKHLFGKFYRASNARMQRPDGTGVGLFLAKKVIDSHGGQVIFESVEGRGSTFGFSLPIKKQLGAKQSDQLGNNEANNDNDTQDDK